MLRCERFERIRIGAGFGLNIGESSLGTVVPPAYGFEVEYDLGIVWSGFVAPLCAADIDGDGLVATGDLLLLLGAWHTVCE